MADDKNKTPARPQEGQLSIDGFETPEAQEAQQDNYTIRFACSSDPACDPNSPEFDPEKYKAALNGDSVQRAMRQMKAKVLTLTREISKAYDAEMIAQLQQILDGLKEWQTLADDVQDYAFDVNDMLPILEEEIAAHQTPDMPPANLDGVLSLMNVDGTPTTEIDGYEINNPYIEIINAALDRYNADKKKKASPRSKAIERGALLSLDGHIASFTADDLRNALTGDAIFELPGAVDEFAFETGTGKLLVQSLGKDKKLNSLGRLHGAFLGAILQGLSMQGGVDNDAGETLSFYLPTIFRNAGIDPREYSKGRDGGQSLSELRLSKIMEILLPFDRLVGRTPDGSYYRVLSFKSYDAESETVEVSAPYLFKAFEMAQALQGKHSNFNKLLRAEAINEQNTAAVEIANRILTGLLTRGNRADYLTYSADGQRKKKKRITTTDAAGNKVIEETIFDAPETPANKDKTVTYRVTFQSVIDDCPQIRSELQAILDSNSKNKTQLYNTKLKKTFRAAYRIIMEKSDAPEIYKNFHFVRNEYISEIMAPTKSTVKTQIIIRHSGKIL